MHSRIAILVLRIDIDTYQLRELATHFAILGRISRISRISGLRTLRNPTHSPIHSLTHSLTHPFTHSPIHSLTQLSPTTHHPIEFLQTPTNQATPLVQIPNLFQHIPSPPSLTHAKKKKTSPARTNKHIFYRKRKPQPKFFSPQQPHYLLS
ncbi:hypothetical protein K440DRAFT_386122 [Wilcoxina mikolae CBS 423.85]|nr:hypothetical protein K440DRAFT_386122 [Wilcoxina mikolae CBS 423.85]